jgi:hypothetical protein
LAAWSLSCFALACTKENPKMDPTLLQMHDATAEEPSPTVRSLRDAPAPARPAPASEVLHPGSVRPHHNARLNGRSGVQVMVGPWHVEWSIPLSPSAPPSAVLAAGDRIVIQALDRWSLHDERGKELRFGARLPGDLVIDPDARLLYFAQHNGFLAAARLEDGEVDLLVQVRFGTGFSRTLLWREGSVLGVHGFARPQSDPHEPEVEPTHTLLEVIDLGDPMVKDDIAFVTSSRKLAGMSSHTTPFLVATSGNELVMATTGHVYRADARLRVVDDVDDPFVPVALSLDEHGRAHLLVRKADATALWIIDVNAGERHVGVTLPSEPVGVPPLVGLDHRVFVLVDTGIMAFETDGRLAWNVSTNAAPVGATIAKNGVLVVSAGSQVLQIEADGRMRTALELGEPLATAPVLVSDRELLVATPTRLVSAAPGVRAHR